MPALLHANGVARFVVTGLLGGTQVANVFHVRNVTGAPWSQADMNTMTNGVALAYTINFTPLAVNTYTTTGCTGQDLTTDTGVTGTAAASVAGTVTSTGVVNNQSTCITWKTAAHYRGGHPRTYLPPTGTSNLTLGHTFVSTYVTNVTTAAQAFIAYVNGRSTSFVPSLILLRRKSGKVDLVPPLTYAITDAVVDSRIDTQRRRLGKDR